MIRSIFGEGSTGLFLVMSVYPRTDSEAPEVQFLGLAQQSEPRLSDGYLAPLRRHKSTQASLCFTFCKRFSSVFLMR